MRLLGLASSERLGGLSGRAKLVALARLLGLLPSLASRPSRLVVGPNDSRLIPEVDNLLICFVDIGVSSAVVDDAVLPPVRFLLLIVTLGGM